MTILEVLVQLRDDIRLWCINNFNNKVSIDRTINGKKLSEDIFLTASDIGLGNVDNTSDANKPVSTAQQAALNTHNTSTSAHNDIRLLIEDVNTKLMNFLDLGTDETMGKEVIDSVSELVDLYEENADLINSITINKVNVSDVIDNLTTASESKVLSANQGVEIKKLIDALQTAVSDKSDISHTHKYAGSSSAGGSADSAVKLTTSTVGSATNPVYFSDGKPVECKYELKKTVPSDAVFTDTKPTVISKEDYTSFGTIVNTNNILYLVN